MVPICIHARHFQRPEVDVGASIGFAAAPKTQTLPICHGMEFRPTPPEPDERLPAHGTPRRDRNIAETESPIQETASIRNHPEGLHDFALAAIDDVSVQILRSFMIGFPRRGELLTCIPCCACPNTAYSNLRCWRGQPLTSLDDAKFVRSGHLISRRSRYSIPCPTNLLHLVVCVLTPAACIFTPVYRLRCPPEQLINLKGGA